MFSFIVTYLAPAFIITSPVTSYADQIRSIHVTKSSRGFSLDTPLIMLVSSILRCFYWLGAEFETSLLLQSFLMIAVQLVLLKVALDNRPNETTPFSTALHGKQRPYNFWQWRPQRPYWEFLITFLITICILQLLLGSLPLYISLTGYLALGIEATLPIPQLVQNARSRTCQGFRFSLLASWILGDVMKQIFFFSAKHIQLQFKVCAIFQFILDLFLCWQFYSYGNTNNTNSSTGVASAGGAIADKRFVSGHYSHPSLSEKIEIQQMNGGGLKGI